MRHKVSSALFEALFFIIVTTCTLTRINAQSVYPPFFNVALRKPIIAQVLDPATPDFPTMCGQSGSEVYCASSGDENSILDCLEETCDAACPYRENLYKVDTISHASDGWSDCVQRVSDFLAPAPGNDANTRSIRFTGSDGGCYVSILRESTVLATIQNWKITITGWIYNSLGNRKGCVVFINVLVV